MTTVTQFAPNNQAPFQFQPTLDGQVYNAVVTWNLFGQRWYVNLYDLNGNLIFSLPLIGSVDALDLSAVSWANGIVTATVTAPHGYPIGTTLDLKISGCSPDAYSGDVSALVTGGSTFTYPVATDPGPATALGLVDYGINLAAGYFSASTLIFRQSSQTFEVSP